jgi:hypothetical protein
MRFESFSKKLESIKAMVAKAKAKNLLDGSLHEGAVTTDYPMACGQVVLLLDGRRVDIAQFDVKLPNAPFDDFLSPRNYSVVLPADSL